MASRDKATISRFVFFSIWIRMLFMSKTSRTKGATFERDIVKRLNEFFESHDINFSCKRNLDQYQKSNLADIQIPYHSVECKHYKEGWWWKPEWWKQVCEAAEHNEIPVLIYKFNHKPVRVCLPLYAISAEYAQNNDLTCGVDFETWSAILEKRWHSYDIDLNWPV